MTASNQPTPSRPFGPIARLVRGWLGIEDQRRDFDALAMTIDAKDQILAGHGRDLEAHGRLLSQMVEQMNRTTIGAVSVQERVAWYEARVPGVMAARKDFDKAAKREQARREKLIAAHPELDDKGKSHVRTTGRLPDPAPENGVVPIRAAPADGAA